MRADVESDFRGPQVRGDCPQWMARGCRFPGAGVAGKRRQDAESAASIERAEAMDGRSERPGDGDRQSRACLTHDEATRRDKREPTRLITL